LPTVGTTAEINKALRGAYFYAQQGSFGAVNLTITSTDQPVKCLVGPVSSTAKSANTRSSSSSSSSSSDASSETSAAEASHMLPAAAFFAGFELGSAHRLLVPVNSSHVLCDSSNSSFSVTKYIPLFIAAVNQPPRLTLESPAFSITVGKSIPVPSIKIVDSDFTKQSLVTSFGSPLLAPVTAVISSGVGRLTMYVTDGLTFLQGTGRDDSVTSVRGAFDAVNTALKNVFYICRVQDGCVAGLEDSVKVLVDDEGFSGRGGPLTATTTINVNII